jgi:hypothetical protein
LLTISSDALQGVLTGKMIEYFESGSPVLGIIVQQNDPEIKSMLNEIQIGDSFSDADEDLPSIKSFIRSEYLHWKSSGTNRKPVNREALMRSYSMSHTIKPLLEAL